MTIAHRPSALAHIDKVMAIAGGQVQALGPKEDVLRKVLATVPAQPSPIMPHAGQPPVVSQLRRPFQLPDVRSEA